MAHNLVREVEEKLAQLMIEDSSDGKDSDIPANPVKPTNPEVELAKRGDSPSEFAMDLYPKIENETDGLPTTDILPAKEIEKDQSEENKPSCHQTLDTAKDLGPLSHNPTDINMSNDHPLTKNATLTDEEDEGIGNGETQSEKDGDTPADLDQVGLQETPAGLKQDLDQVGVQDTPADLDQVGLQETHAWLKQDLDQVGLQ